MGESRIRQAALRDPAREIGNVGTQLGQDVRNLQSQLTGDGDPWGADEVGSLVGVAYQEITQLALETYGNIAERLGTVSEGLTGMADIHRGKEQANTEAAKGIGL